MKNKLQQFIALPATILRKLTNIELALGRIESRQNNCIDSQSINDYEFKVSSQWGEDGIIINARIFNTNNKLIRDIPLLFDVLKGNISIVGSTLINSDETSPGILCKPGITGLERLKNIKIESETRKSAQQYYIQNQNLKLDVEIIIKTLLNG